jgi:hypothetical protein
MKSQNRQLANATTNTGSGAMRALVLLLVSVAWLIVPAQAGSIGGSFDGNAILTTTSTVGVFIQNFVGDGTDGTYGAFDATSQSTVDFRNPPNILITNGTLTEIFAGGDLFGTGSGSGTASGHGTATFTIDFVITGGPGIFEHQTGDAVITGTITQTSQTTEAIEATYTGMLGTPEPSSESLLLLGATVGYRFLAKTRFK